MRSIENCQRNMLRRMNTFELNLEELQTQVSRIDRRTAQHVDELDSSVHNAHECITELQADFRTRNLAAADTAASNHPSNR